MDACYGFLYDDGNDVLGNICHSDCQLQHHIDDNGITFKRKAMNILDTMEKLYSKRERGYSLAQVSLNSPIQGIWFVWKPG